ncbi:MAG: hypothetical protein U0271_26895 [Polyangiaceae bacterium]
MHSILPPLRLTLVASMLPLVLALGACSDDSSDSKGGSTTGGGGASSQGGAGGAGGAEPVTPSLVMIELPAPVDLTSDGSVALLEDPASPEVDVYLFDAATAVLEKKTTAGDASIDLVTGLSNTLRVSALHDNPAQAAFFHEPEGWNDLASPFPAGCDVNVGGAWDLSDDGAIVVGFMWDGCAPRAFRWVDDDAGGVVQLLDVLGTPSTGGNLPPTNRASVVSADGEIAAGFAQVDFIDRFPARWRADGSGELLDGLPTDTPGEVLSISADGSVLAGLSGFDAFRWTEADGATLLPRLETALPTDPMFANAMSADGSMIWGGSGDAFSGVPVAFVWTAAGGTRALEPIITALGLDLPLGFTLTNVLAASADGTVVLGTALDPNTLETQSFLLRLPLSAYDP